MVEGYHIVLAYLTTKQADFLPNGLLLETYFEEDNVVLLKAGQKGGARGLIKSLVARLLHSSSSSLVAILYNLNKIPLCYLIFSWFCVE